MQQKKNYLFIIPARGGSKGMVGKNLRHVGGVPLVGRALRVARETVHALGGQGHRVICSTEDDDIAVVAQQWGGEVPFLRPAELADDRASTIDVVLNVLEQLGTRWRGVVLLQPTSPLRTSADVLAAIQLYEQLGCSVVSLCPAEHPLEWSYRLDGEQCLIPVLERPLPYQRQQVEPGFHINGAVYIASTAQLTSQRSFIIESTRACVMPVDRSMDIDTEHDLILAEAVLASRLSPPISLGGRRIGSHQPCFIIAEIGVNHNGSLDLARELVDAAVEAGVDAVKFQTFSSERLAAPNAPQARYQARNIGREISHLEMLKGLELSQADHHELMAYCADRVLFLSSPFDEQAADQLADLGVLGFKIPSGELTNHPYLAHIAAKGLPMLISTGMSSTHEVESALAVVRRFGAPPVALFHCVSSYPAPHDEANLRAMVSMKSAFGVPVGWSDHTEGSAAALAAVALGATMVEKHFTLDRSLPGPDHRASIEPAEMGKLVLAIRQVEQSLGDPVKRPVPSEQDTARVVRKSLHARRPLDAGHILAPGDVVALRPAGGIPPARIDEVVGHCMRVSLATGQMLRSEDIEAPHNREQDPP